MTKFSRTRRVAVPADIAYNVAADVQSYVLFVPLLKQVNLRSPVREQNGLKTFRAELTISYKKMNLRESFVSDVVCDPANRRVTSETLDAPFRHLKAVWTIREAGEYSDVQIDIDFSLRSMLLQIAASAAIGTVIDRVIPAFEKRAKDLYSASKIS